MSCSILCLGDSLTYGYGVPAGACWIRLTAHRTGLHLRNHGLCGDTLNGMLRRLPDALSEHPEACLVIGGTNDIFSGHDPDRSAVCQIVSACRNAGVQPLLGTPPPMDWVHLAPQWAAFTDRRSSTMLTEYVQWLRRYAADEQLPLADIYAVLTKKENFDALFTDGVHLSALGNQTVADTVCQLLSAINLYKIDKKSSH